MGIHVSKASGIAINIENQFRRNINASGRTSAVTEIANFPGIGV
jgi:hypothetical protein